MSLLALIAPARHLAEDGERRSSSLQAGSPSHAGSAARPGEWSWALSRDGHAVDAQGHSALKDLPVAHRVVLVLHEADVAWLPARLPPVRSARMREALSGLLEDRLLSDPDSTHLALGPTATDGQSHTWVAAVDRAWVGSLLQALSAAGREVDAVVAGLQPAATPQAHARADAAGRLEALFSGPQGVGIWPLHTGQLPPGGGDGAGPSMVWSAEPAVAQMLQDRCGVQAPLVGAATRALRAASSGSNLLQFDLAPRTKASRAVRLGWNSLAQPHWRAVRVGLLALVVVQVIGLQVAAWRAEQQIRDVEQRTVAVMQATFPSIQVVIDPAEQSRREVERLRRSLGQPAGTDIETWLDLIAPLAAPGAAGIRKVRLDRQGLVLESDGAPWSGPVVSVVQAHAARQGWSVRVDGSRLHLAPAGSKGAAG